MDRRKFIQNGLTAAVVTSSINAFAGTSNMAFAEKPFNAKFAPHDGMFKNNGGASFLDQIKFMHDMGFRAIEDNGMMQRSKDEQEKIGNLLAQLGMTMGVFVVDAGDNWKVSYTTGNKDLTAKFVDTCKQAVETAKRVNAKWMTVVPGYYDRKLPIGIQTANVVEVLRRGAEVFEPQKLTMVLEPLSDNPDLFMRTAPQTYELCKAVSSSSCKILYDIYHMQRNEGNIINTIEWCWDEIAYYQIGDNPGRNEPGTGEVNYKNIFKYVHDKGYRGVWGMEHGNSKSGKDGEMAVIKAYRDSDVASA
jgi:hydroxypyruvate isomerase